MAKRTILTIGKHEKRLRTKSEPVKKIDKDIRQLAEDIRDTITGNPAVGLAAVQIGILKRVFGVRLGYYDEPPQEETPPTIFINPEIIDKSEEVERGFDACMSIPGMMGYTDRHVRIKVRYQDEKGQKHEREFAGWDARMIEHEYDHLDGVLFLERVKSYDDLFVLSTDKDGKRQQIPYSQLIDQAKETASDGKLDKLPELKKEE